MRRSSEAFRQRPIPPIELATWWIEHVIKNGGAPHIQSEARHINWIVYNSIDVLLFWLGILFLLIVALRKLIKIFKTAFCRGKISRDTKTKTQ